MSTHIRNITDHFPPQGWHWSAESTQPIAPRESNVDRLRRERREALAAEAEATPVAA